MIVQVDVEHADFIAKRDLKGGPHRGGVHPRAHTGVFFVIFVEHGLEGMSQNQ
jgi:hypothetical protein